MEQQAKRVIKSLVLELRKKLEDDVAVQLKRYGFSGERWLPPEQLPHIQEDDRATIDHFRLKAALEQHLRRIGAEPQKATPKQRAEAVGWFVREVAFTHLNRLVALKCLEVRDLIPEIITTSDSFGGRSRAHSDYRNSHPEEAAQPDDALPAAIRHTCRQVYTEFKFLFDVGDPATGREAPSNTILWPSYPVLKECVGLINGLDEAADHQDDTLWAEDEIIGWIYQFYNAEEKQAIRKRGRPRVPAEVAVINQFFTPRWIVKFLVDNTLGRLWLEMHPDSERVRAKCDYLVPEPLAQDENEAGKSGEQRFPLDPDSPINDSGAPPRRDPKRPQDIRLIDPACGTMHFGHYAFEVFQEIYRDARDHNWVTDSDALTNDDIPEAILRNNLYGVDIDLRAVQLAGLSLFIKAKTATPTANISQVNLVVADAVLPDDGSRQRFLEQYKDDKVVQDAVKQVLDEMANVAEVGSLLRVEERLRDILVAARHEAVQDWDLDRLQELPGFERPLRQLSLAETTGAVPDQWGAHYTLARLLDDLRGFATEALQTHDLNAQLFAEEVEKTVHLLDVFLNDYDVLVMNPPYGYRYLTTEIKQYMKAVYPQTSNDIYAAFMQRAVESLQSGGYLGALTSRTYLSLSSFQPLREKLILGASPPVVILDLGFNVLDDAFVETAATVLRRSDTEGLGDRSCIFFRLNVLEADRQTTFRQCLELISHDTATQVVYPVALTELGILPGSSFAYWASASLRRMFKELPPLQPTAASVKVGLQTGNDSRFVRLWWEVPLDSIGQGNRWIPFAKGGDYCKYYYDLDLVVDWAEDGHAIKHFCGTDGRLRSRPQNETYYFREGLTFPMTTVKGFNSRHLRAGSIISVKGSGIYFADPQRLWAGLGLLNSSLAQIFLLMMTPSRDYQVGYIAPIPYYLPGLEAQENLAQLALSAHDLKSTWDTGNETCSRFDAPWLAQAHKGALLPDFEDLHSDRPPMNQLTALLDYVREVEQAADARLEEFQAQIDAAVYHLYQISRDDRALIERELRHRPPELAWPQMERKSDEEKRREHVRRLISYLLLQALKADRDGIVPITPGTGQPTALDEVRREMEGEFGEDAAFTMESDIKEVLGDSIADWLDKHFFKWHIKLHKRRPVIWHLASPRNTFASFVYLHKLDRDTLRKVQTQYLWPARRTVEGELETAKAEKESRRIEQAESTLDDLEEFEKRLLRVIRCEVECDIPEWAEGPFRGGVYDPVLDDGVKVNITPLQEAGLLRYKKVV